MTYLHVEIQHQKSTRIHSFKVPRQMIQYLRTQRSRIIQVLRIWESDQWRYGIVKIFYETTLEGREYGILSNRTHGKQSD